MGSIPQEYMTFIVWLTPILSLTFNIVFVLSIMFFIKKSSRANANGIDQTSEKIAHNIKLAEFEATELLKDASARAKKIIEEAGVIKESLEDKLEQSLDEMNSGLIQKLQEEEMKILDEFKKLFGNLTQAYQTEGTKIAERFKDEGDTMVKTFIQSVHAEINSVREKIFSRIDTKLTLIDEDLSKYREQQYEKMSQNVMNTAKDTLLFYLKDALTYELHEDIVFKSLEKYKQGFMQKNADVS